MASIFHTELYIRSKNIIREKAPRTSQRIWLWKMYGWDSIHQKFRDIKNQINYDDLTFALRNTKAATLQRLAAQLCLDEASVERDVKSLSAKQFTLTENIARAREEYRQLQICNCQIDNNTPVLQSDICQLEANDQSLLKELDRLRCDTSREIGTEKRKFIAKGQAFDRERRQKTENLDNLFHQILVLRAGQLVQCEFLEDLVERKPGVLAKFKEQLKCKRKKLMQLQVQQQDFGMQASCDQQRQSVLRRMGKKLRERDAKARRKELEQIRQQTCAMDELVRSYTEEVGVTFISKVEGNHVGKKIMLVWKRCFYRVDNHSLCVLSATIITAALG